jgi:hypothetical protein
MSSHERDSRTTLSNHTRTCNTVADVYLWTQGVPMDVDRGVLARIDLKALAGLRRDETCRVRVPVSGSRWSWCWYCDVFGSSMGQGVCGLV